MKLQRENNQSHEYKSLRNTQVFRIVGNEDQSDLIERIDTAIGSEIKCYDGANRPLTWRQECSDCCADYVYGTGCGWIIDKDDVAEFKALWKKYKSMK